MPTPPADQVRLDPRAIRLLRARRRARLVLLIVLLLVTVAVLAALATREAGGSTDHDRYHQRRFAVVEVVQGDALLLLRQDGERFPVRLIGVEANGSPAAREVAAALCGDEVLLYLEVVPSRNHAGELLAYVYGTEGVHVNARLVETGVAFADRRWDYSFLRTFLQLEEQARTRGAGIWGDMTEERMPEWRRRWLAELRKEPWKRQEWRRPDEP